MSIANTEVCPTEIRLVSDLWQVCVFFYGTPVSSTSKTDRHHITEILLKVAINTTNLNQAQGGLV
jgi:hypothetical protein